MTKRRVPPRGRFLTWWDQNFLAAERTTALVGTAALTLSLLNTDVAASVMSLLSGSRSTVYGTLAGIFGSLLGFTITAVAIVLSFADSSRMALIRESPHYVTLWEIFKSSIRWLGAATCIALAALIVDRDRRPYIVVTVVVVYASLVSVLRVGRTIWILELLIGLVTSRPKTD
jgi:hypothetical protein